MTQEEVLEYNKRCAEFLGWKNLNNDSFPEYIDKLGNFYPLKELKFHSDWNWIMEVVEAIEKLGYYTNILSTNNNSMKHTMHINKVHEEEKYTLFVDSKKQTVVKTINEFLNWYKNEKIHSN